MVTNPRKAQRPSAIRALNRPVHLQIKADAQGRPAAVLINRRWLQVQEVLEAWRVDDEWWRTQPVSRMYYRVEMAVSGAMVLFQDLLSGTWYRQQA